jgi:hypothetical protein
VPDDDDPEAQARQRLLRRAAVITAAVVVVAFVATILVVSQHGSSAPAAADTAGTELSISVTPFSALPTPSASPLPVPHPVAPKTTAPPPTHAAIQPLTNWLDDGGRAALTRTAAAASGLETGFDGKSPAEVRSACLAVGSSISALAGVGPLPGASQPWSAALAQLTTASTECVSGVDTKSATLLAKAQQDAKAGYAAATQALTAARD